MSFDAVVVGLGGVGSAALYYLAAAGAKVLGLDRYPPGHTWGSSHGETRVIRLAYFEHPDYVPLLRTAYAGWRHLAAQSGQDLYWETGALQVGPAHGTVIPGILASAQTHGLAVETLDAATVARTWPGFGVPPQAQAVFEAQAGILRVERCVTTYVAEAQKLGAQITIDPCLSYGGDAHGVWVQTRHQKYTAGGLAVAAGAWSGALLAHLGLPLTIVKKTQFWFPSTPAYQAPRAPVFLYELPEGVFYGIGAVSAQGVKVAQHSGGQPVPAPVSPDAPIPTAEAQAVTQFAATYLPQLPQPFQRTAGCMYTVTPDHHFVVDTFAELRGAYVCGLSGHGFKFAPVLGQALADLTLQGTTSHPLTFMGRARLGA